MRFMYNSLTPNPSPKRERGVNAYNLICVLLCLFTVSLISFSCTKGEKKEYDATPELEFVGVSSQSVMQQDNITFTIKYTDGDGDLGENNPNVKNLFLIDNRINISEAYRISQLAPSGSSVPIQGNLNVELKNVVLTDSSAQQTTTFSIYVVDRAGHQSKPVTSPVVTIRR